MKYTLELICNEFNKNKIIDFLFFWGHTENNKKEVTKACLSQWYLSDFTVNGVLYNCAEKYMMAEKARLFKDFNVLDKILAASKQSEIKRLGRMVKNFNENIWNERKIDIVVKGNIEKFSQNEELKKFLLNTKNKIIVEASPYDSIWGVGLSVNNENITNPNKWSGKNLLGFALMEVRDFLNEI